MQQNILTVIIPVFNGENSISRALLCLQDQTLQNFNVMIINDCSTDSTQEIIEDFAKKNKNTSVINLSKN